MAYDPLDDGEFIDINNDADDEDLGSHVEQITTIGTSNEWTNFRQNLMKFMMKTQLDSERGPGKNKRKWNEKEDEKLVAAMLDVLNSSPHYKSDNGFKPGFLQAVEKQLAILLPEAGIKAKPHIKSRIKTMKSDWSIVHDMLSCKNTSGFGWDYNNEMLDAPQDVWKAYLQVHTNAKRWRGKKFPHYRDLCNVFGNDRANGRDAFG
ncbi:uncharacterized protein At2g29880-like [Bidens hawaiensis]|uniref:uncharacterized protein At2g29880-like n=1 Tax=Bidens hawaiensis TaxID=980011 RepID=UPI00404B4A8D